MQFILIPVKNTVMTKIVMDKISDAKEMLVNVNSTRQN